VSREEFEKLHARMTAADKRASEEEEKRKALEREKMSETEKVAAELKDVTAERDNLKTQVTDLRLENAFLSDNKYTWHDPQDALRLIDLDGVEVKDGKVTGLSEAIEKLAKNKKHLLKTEEEGKSSSAASGSATNGTRKGDKKDPPKNYSSRFPALRNAAGSKSTS
jgi:seryl-tRNA synthetase